MNRSNLIIGLRLLILLAVDIFLISRLRLGVYFVPHIYFLSLIMLPVRTSKATLLIFGFVSGLIMDLFMLSGGLFAASATMMAFVRIFILRLYLSPEDEDNNIHPGLQSFGIRAYLIYSSILILVSQFTFFSLEAFKTDS